MKYLLTGFAALAMAACGQQDAEEASTETDAPEAAEPAQDAGPSSSEVLAAVLEAQSDDTKARYQYRHPQETLEFFGIKPGMTVVDTLPGKPGWYAPILMGYLGADGHLIGADYSMEMWPLFVNFATPEWIEERKNWANDYKDGAAEFASDDSAKVSAYVYGSAPEDLAGTVDAVLMVRAVHHFNRFEDQGGWFTSALEEVTRILKPGGVIGVVQHRAPEDAPDDWAKGDNGYVKQSQVIAFFEAAGFELVGESEVNANSKDQPTTSDFVWRLPPTLGTSGEDAELKAQMEAIGESDRMTLLFRKPE